MEDVVMPQLQLVLSNSVRELCTEDVFAELASTLARVVEATLKLKPHEVAVHLVVPEFSYNMKPLQIIVLASASPQRLALMMRVREDLYTGLLWLGMSKSIYMQNFLKAVREVEIWPIMPEGSWESYQIAD
jgi:hypothetical protein